MSQVENTNMDNKRLLSRDPDELGLQSVPYRFLTEESEEDQEYEISKEDSVLR